MSPEYPEFPGSEKIGLWSIMEETSNGALWQLFRDRVTERSSNIDCWLESSAKWLIQDPQSKTIIGVAVEREGKVCNIQATNGIVLATGGFENNPEMVETYLGFTRYAPVGTLYNTGDGIRMALDVGADLWHMEVYEGVLNLGGASLAVPQGERANLGGTYFFGKGSSILVGNDGNRYLREDESPRHGHIYYAGVWVNPKRPLKSYVIADQTEYEEKGSIIIPESLLDFVIRADSFEELAEKTGMDKQIFLNTISNFNGYAKAGYDPQFGRKAENMRAFGEGPYYAIEVIPVILNTQGGPRRNENAEVLDKEGNPIPHLYSAGELGGIAALQYQGGGNIAECVIFGEIAGANAAAEKAPLPEYSPPTKVESNLVYVPGAVTDIASSSTEIATADNEYVGVGSGGMGGNITVKITMQCTRIAGIEVVDHRETEGIGTLAIERLPQAMIDAQSTDVDSVSGATLTSNAIKSAVEDALSKIS
jgi:uncharacterized protein with FMN-binding domain